jgi:deferrochelatase/peroxidase EfeB
LEAETVDEWNKTETEAGPAERPGKKNGTPISRRDLLKTAGAGGLGLLFGAAGFGGILAVSNKGWKAAGAAAPASGDRVPFYGAHQAGILTPAQNFLCFASFDLTTSRVQEVKELFRIWTAAAAKMAAGELVGEETGNPILPPTDTGEAAGLSPSRTTITFGVGPSLFDHRFGLAAKRPEALADLPKFPGDNLRSEWCGGDIGVQVCSDDFQVAFHAVRNLTRLARGTAVLRWTQEGFLRTGAAASSPNETPRNLMGFKDGTGNPDTQDSKLMNDLVWAQASDGPAWMAGGTYMVARRIRIRIEVWDRSSLADQEATFGRYRGSGAPLGAKYEFDPLPLEAKNADGQPVVPLNSHVRLAHSDGKEKILRRSYSYSSGIDRQTGQLDAGLMFLCFQRDIRKQFIPIQQRLSKQDKLNEYITHLGSAVFACFPGAREGEYIGQALFEE